MLKQLKVPGVDFVVILFVIFSIVTIIKNEQESFVVTCFLMALVGWIYFIPLALYRLKKQWELGEDEINAIQSSLLTLDVVDSQLHLLAKRFKLACDEEVRFRGTTDTFELWIDAKKKEVARLKADFWTAHTLAKRLGYETKPKVGDYLKLPILHDEDDE